MAGAAPEVCLAILRHRERPKRPRGPLESDPRRPGTPRDTLGVNHNDKEPTRDAKGDSNGPTVTSYQNNILAGMCSFREVEVRESYIYIYNGVVEKTFSINTFFTNPLAFFSFMYSGLLVFFL